MKKLDNNIKLIRKTEKNSKKFTKKKKKAEIMAKKGTGMRFRYFFRDHIESQNILL